MMRPVLLATIICLLVSCYSLPNVKKGSRFSPQAKTGYLMFVVNVEGDPAGLILRATLIRELPRIADWHKLKPGKNFVFIKAPAGSYKLETVFDRSFKRVFTDFALEEFAFTVEQSVVTYGGELVLAPDESLNKFGNRVLDIRYSWRDSYPEAVAYLRTNYPELPDTIAVRNECPETSEHYYLAVIAAGD
jgi:hypothetical protein